MADLVQSVGAYAQAAAAAVGCYAATFQAYAGSNPYAFSALVVAAVLGAMSVGTLVVPWLITFVTYWPQDLKRKYNAQWAIVTGGSSGIGLSLCRKLAEQGLNIVVAAVPDDLLRKAGEELRAAFPHIQVRVVGVNLAASNHNDYLEPIAEATADIPVQVVFSNAGYVVTGFFGYTPLAKWIANLHCNETASIAIAHLFVSRMLKAGLRGCIVFTSSPANIIPSPFSTLYGATKSAITHFASSLACEVKGEGIDVSVLHPSPVATRFYNDAHKLPTLQMFKSTAIGPDAVAETAIRGVGRNVIIDQGYYPITFKLLMRIIEFTLMVDIMARISTSVKDYQFLKQETLKAAAAAEQAAKAPAAVADGVGLPAPASATKRRRNSSATGKRA